MNPTPSPEGVAMQMLLSVGLCSAICLGFVHFQQPLAYLGLGFTVGLVLLAKRLLRPLPAGVPRWAALAVLPVDALLWPTAIVADVLAAMPRHTNDE